MTACWVWTRFMVLLIILFLLCVVSIKAKPFGCADMMSGETQWQCGANFSWLYDFIHHPQGEHDKYHWQCLLLFPGYNKGHAAVCRAHWSGNYPKKIWIWETVQSVEQSERNIWGTDLYTNVFQVFIGNIPHWLSHLRGRIYKTYQLLGGKKT